MCYKKSKNYAFAGHAADLTDQKVSEGMEKGIGHKDAMHIRIG